ncbi:MAG TPA: MarR family winged helix-turn-helix transcriptional regulator [Nocardioidaceae bacterium]|nr:MarR family winged helix-turn-helix transcriptional regulator [Nocardioidaceae bacterium]
MSRPAGERLDATPLIALVHRADRALQADMVQQAREAGYDTAKLAHNAVFGHLPLAGARSVDLAARAGMTRQSMGEVVRELVDLGVLEMQPDPEDRRAKLVTFSEAGKEQVRAGMAHISEFQRRLVAELGEDGYNSLCDGLRKVVELLEGPES